MRAVVVLLLLLLHLNDTIAATGYRSNLAYCSVRDRLEEYQMQVVVAAWDAKVF